MTLQDVIKRGLELGLEAVEVCTLAIVKAIL